MHAEAQQYRERIRGAKLRVYEQYLWRKQLMADHRKQADYMRSPEWDQVFSEKIHRCGGGAAKQLPLTLLIPAHV